MAPHASLIPNMLLPKLALLTVFCASLASADVVIRLSGDQDPACQAGFICVTSNSFAIQTNSSGGGFFDAINNVGMNITSLQFDLDYNSPGCPTGAPAPVTLALGPSFQAFDSGGLSFSTSSKCTSAANVAEYLLSLQFTPGIPNNQIFQVNLNTSTSTDPNGAGGWLPNTMSTVMDATSIPEPRLLGFVGLALIAIMASELLSRIRRRES